MANPAVKILSTSSGYQNSGTGSLEGDGVILNDSEYLTLTGALAELKVDYKVGSGTTVFANITKNIYYLSSNGESNASDQDPSHQQNVIIGVRQQGLLDRVKDLGNEQAGMAIGQYQKKLELSGLCAGSRDNNVCIDKDGELVLNGTATVWDDVRVVPGSFDFPGVTDPALVDYTPSGTGAVTKLYEFDKDDIGYFQVQIPHTYKSGSDIYVHLHWTPGSRGNEESGNLVGWKVLYSWASLGGTFGAMQTADLSDACNGVDHQHQMTPEVLISGAGQTVSSMLICQVTRTDTGTDDTWVSTTTGQLPLLLEVDFHFEISRWGTKTPSM